MPKTSKKKPGRGAGGASQAVHVMPSLDVYRLLAADWGKVLGSPKFRRAVANFVSTIRKTMKLGASSSVLDFAAALTAYAPIVSTWIPEDVRAERRFAQTRERMAKSIAKSDWSTDDARALASFVCATACGVKTAALLYDGGWDEREATDDLQVSFRAGICTDEDEARERAQKVVDYLNVLAWHGEVLSLTRLLMNSCDDSGAGPPLYSQNVEMAFATGTTRLHGYQVYSDDETDVDDE